MCYYLNAHFQGQRVKVLQNNCLRKYFTLKCIALYYFNILKDCSTSKVLEPFVLLLLIVVNYELRIWSDLHCHYICEYISCNENQLLSSNFESQTRARTHGGSL